MKVQITRHYEGPNQDLYAAATAEARTIAGPHPVRAAAVSHRDVTRAQRPPDCRQRDPVLHHQRWPYLMTAESPSGEHLPPQVPLPLRLGPRTRSHRPPRQAAPSPQTRRLAEWHQMSTGERHVAWSQLRAWVTWLYDRYELGDGGPLATVLAPASRLSGLAR